ncbi:MAG: AbrB/MazE/SpoVT family DNA-binding domain-containing protein [Candidatus Omnitrophica bacterium]|nr:AbrB/MazE/SpoVT family DNA-binding domain-containing protein [Candidatus Omnitrophota bacterium]MBU4479223.1 AbrB/MazE/SpoVT family DNA-binding domain-containing protein [Candidatus Omnitrophota bacterium]MCG2703913.1 AbrB/MazE/SpoVT family DNA-binding domain-containing protein [Candidatus Omnitrophota bacterium]
MLCKKTIKNQITLPKKIMDGFVDFRYFDVAESKGRIILTPVRIKPAKESMLSGVREKISSLGVSENDIEKAIEWARKK